MSDDFDETDILLNEHESKPRRGMASAGSRTFARTSTEGDDNTFIDQIRTSAQTDISHLADKSQGAAGFAAVDDDVLAEQPFIGHRYEDFHTIDWQRDLARDRLRHKFLVKRRRQSVWGWISGLYDASSGWICVLLVGLAAGTVAGVIDIGTEWMIDLKDGICPDKFWLNKEHCCWTSNTTHCDLWLSWPNVFGVHVDPTRSSSSGFYIFLDLLCYVGCATAMAGLCVTLVKMFAPYACGSGIPEIKCILSGFIIRGYLGKWTFVVKSVGLMLAAASGLSLGKEGPMVHLACCVGNIFSYMFPKYGKNEAKKREILSASAAAGVSVAFGAPVGGVLFSLEEASYYFPLKTLWRSFFCALVAGFSLKLLNPFGSYQQSLFEIDYDVKWTFPETFPFAVLGIFGGVIGAVFIFANIKWCQFRKNSKRLGGHPIFEVLIVSLITAFLSFWNPYTRQSASSLIRKLFDRCGVEDHSDDLCDYSNRTYQSAKGDVFYGDFGQMGEGINSALIKLIAALFLKLFFTVFTFGIKVPAGLFVPSMAIGACAGRVFGIFMEHIAHEHEGAFDHCSPGKDCVLPGLYAMVGAAAVLGGVTRMTVSLVVIMFELTGSLTFIVPTMIAVMFAKWVGDAIGKIGIYDAHIVLNAYPFLDNKEEFTYSTVAAQVMRPRPGGKPLRVLTQDTMSVGDIEQLMLDEDYNGFPVVVSTELPYIVGFVTRRDLKLALSSARKTQDGIVTNSIVYFSSTAPNMPEIVGGPCPLRLRKLMDMAPVTVTDQTPMETVIDMIRKLGLRHVLVTHNGRLLGIITKKDVLEHIGDHDRFGDHPAPPPQDYVQQQFNNNNESSTGVGNSQSGPTMMTATVSEYEFGENP